MIPNRRELFVEGTVRDLPQVLDFVDNVCDQAAVDQEWCFDLQLAVEEACCNVLEHAYGEAGGAFRVVIETTQRRVKITVQDWGQPFDPALVAPPDMAIPLEDRPIGGLGLHLIHQVMDDVKFAFGESGNTLVMVKSEQPTSDQECGSGTELNHPTEEADG